MKKTEFTKQVVQLLRLSETRPAESARSFLALHKKVQKVARAGLSETDAQDCIGFAAGVLERSGQYSKSVIITRQLVSDYKADILYASHGLANATARAALLCFKLKRIAEANKLACEALELFGTFPEPSPMIEQLGAYLKLYRDR